MISIHVLLLLSSAFAVVNGQPEVPDCSACKYNDNIGYYKSRNYCSQYWMCRVNPFKSGHYKSDRMCCPEGQVFDPEHLTCTWKKHEDPCEDIRDSCPEYTTIPYEENECPYKASTCPTENDPEALCLNSKFFKSKHHSPYEFECPYGTDWDQSICSCQYGEEFHHVDEGCQENSRQILEFLFTEDFDSFVCSNFASGIPHGTAIITEKTLCLDGYGYLQIPFLYNWFAWNDVALTFTLCFNFRPSSLDEQGLFATHCEYEFEDTAGEMVYPYRFIDIYIAEGTLKVEIAGNTINTAAVLSTAEFQSVCIQFAYGEYLITYNGNDAGAGQLPEPSYGYPVNSHSAASLGFVPGHGEFTGYIDDFSFWTYTDEDLVADFASAAPTNDNSYTAPVEGDE